MENVIGSGEFKLGGGQTWEILTSPPLVFMREWPKSRFKVGGP